MIFVYTTKLYSYRRPVITCYSIKYEIDQRNSLKASSEFTQNSEISLLTSNKNLRWPGISFEAQVMGMEHKKNQKTGILKIISSASYSVLLHRGTGPFSMETAHDTLLPIFLIMVHNDSPVSIKGSGIEETKVFPDRWQIFFAEEGKLKIFNSRNEKWEFFEIRIAVSAFKEFPDTSSALWHTFNTKISSGMGARLCHSGVNYNHILKNITHSLLYEQLPEAGLNRMYVDLKLKELLLHMLQEAVFASGKQKAVSDFSVRDHQLTLKAKELLQKQKGKKTFTTKSLAKKLGINETTLKIGFKKITGSTNYQFYLQTNMREAQKLLQQGNSVSKVAKMVGFKNTSHFSFAFKRTFGITPSQLK